METRNIYSPVASRVVRVTDIGGTFVFAIQGGLAAVLAHLDPVGVVVLAFLSALGGGIMRDLLIGARPIAAVGNWRYMAIVLTASATIWAFHSTIRAVPFMLMAGLGAVGLSLFAVAGTQKALDYDVNPFVAIFLGTLGAVGGSALRDIVLRNIPRVLWTDIYASAAALAALIVVVGHILRLPSRITAIVAAIACFSLRMIAVKLGWNLPTDPG
jgi:uncharacterized membrane protein YeiH